MKKITLLFLLFTLGIVINVYAAPRKDLWKHWNDSNEQSTIQINNKPFADFLKHYVHTNAKGVNLVYYSKVTADDKHALTQYLNYLAHIKVLQLNRAQQEAYWINLYNALTIKIVVDYYPVESIREINISPGYFQRGPWKKNLIKINGTWVSLNDIEHRILRPIYNDPRLHYALNCASMGCPNLSTTPYTSQNLNTQLNDAAKSFINSTRAVAIKDEKLNLSKIYEWYKNDFGKTDQDVIKHLEQYASAELKVKLTKFKTINGYHYNWTLNGDELDES